jgi:L-galactose dehydrogenase/L-glyceraldehyde 3-phosphate reductase
MEQRTLGRTGLKVSALGFGCGAVGGLMVGGTAADQERAVARAVDAGINYFDTAAQYGNGESEKNLGRVLKTLKPNVLVGTKVRVPMAERGRIGAAIAEALEASLGRLGREQVDLFQLHNTITDDGKEPSLSAETVLNEVVPALERLRDQGKTRFYGITAIGDASAMHKVVGARMLDTAQVPYNLLNPSPVSAIHSRFPAHDYRQLMLAARDAGMGVIGIRVLAGGALSGDLARHPLAMPSVDPIGTAASYADDTARARRLLPLVTEGHVGSLIEAAIRFAISSDAMSTVLVGYSTMAQLEEAITHANKGRLSQAALDRVAALQAGFVT